MKAIKDLGRNEVNFNFNNHDVFSCCHRALPCCNLSLHSNAHQAATKPSRKLANHWWKNFLLAPKYIPCPVWKTRWTHMDPRLNNPFSRALSARISILSSSEQLRNWVSECENTTSSKRNVGLLPADRETFGNCFAIHLRARSKTHLPLRYYSCTIFNCFQDWTPRAEGIIHNPDDHSSCNYS